jgi:hypothetical protein
MKIHPRVSIVAKARSELAIALLNIVENNDLTYGEIHSIINDEQSSWIKYQIREERHPNNPDKPGGLA